MDVPTAVALSVSAAACVSDVRTRRIPNALTFGSAVAALSYFAWTGGLPAMGRSVGGWAVGCGLFFAVFLLRGMGAGDVKLLAALGSWLGPSTVFWAGLYGAIAGGVIAIPVAMAHGYLGKAVSNVGYAIWYWRVAGPRPVPELTLADAKSPRLPYAIPITVGVIAALWLR